VTDCIQQVTLDFDMGTTTINPLQRLRRSDGQVEVVPLTHLGGTTWRLAFNLEGGTGDLFKYNDGTPFVGAQAVQPTKYWDNDGVATGNNTTTGAGLGGGGSWNSGIKWFNGTSNAAWTTNANAVFWGTGGTVTLSAPRSVDGLSFKSNGYTLTASTLTLSRPFVSVDSGVTATIASAVAGTIGLTKNGAGTLRLTNANTFSGGVTINGGKLEVTSDAALGVAPTTLQTNISLNGGTLRWGTSFDLGDTRAIAIGPDGGTIDTQGFSNPTGYNATAGGFRGPGDLTKIGSGTFFAAATTGGANTTWKGRLILKEGTWKIVASDGLPYNVPLADGLQADQVTLDGGTWQIGGNLGVTSARRGITVLSGGTIDTQGFNFGWAGPMAGSNVNAVLNKVGSGMLRFTGVGPASSYNGIVNINEGTLRLDNGITMGSLATINLADVAGATLHVTGNQTIGSLAGGGSSGGNVTLGDITLTTGGNNKSTTFGGVISGPGALTKTGTGTFKLNGTNTYAGVTTIAAGKISLDGAIAGSVIVKSGATLAGDGTIGGTTTVQSGGVLSPGNSPGTLHVGALTLNGGSTMQMELGATNDAVIVDGTATLGGTMAISIVSGFTPVVGQMLTLIDANSRSGMFSSAQLPTFGNLTLDVIYDSQSVFVKVVPILAGDFNADGTVNTADYIVWRKGGSSYSQNDYDDWQRNFGRSLPAGGSPSNAYSNVPEPLSGMLLSIAIFLFSGGRCLNRSL
jgi:autotransporter-associated beta strand protein